MDKPRCYWCHTYHDILYEKLIVHINRFGFPNGEVNEYFCSERCYASADHCLKKTARFSTLLVSGISVCVLLIIFSLRLSRNWNIPYSYILGAAVGLMGGLLVWTPVTTPETIQYMGMKKGVQFTRAIGAGFVVAAVVLVTFI